MTDFVTRDGATPSGQAIEMPKAVLSLYGRNAQIKRLVQEIIVNTAAGRCAHKRCGSFSRGA